MSGLLSDPVLVALEQEVRADFHKILARLEGVLANVAQEKAKVARQKAELRREIESMQMHAEQQKGRIELNIGGHRFETSVQTLRRVPDTFFTTYFSGRYPGRYAQDVCVDGSIFIDRNIELFKHVLEYMRDGVLLVADRDNLPDPGFLRALRAEFDFYSIDVKWVPVRGGSGRRKL
jgi:hypothetical protein